VSCTYGVEYIHHEKDVRLTNNTIARCVVLCCISLGTSLSFAPSGKFLWAGFSDGTVRVFDLSGRFGIESDDIISDRKKSGLFVSSKWCQIFGAVACQIHARGVHTDLQTTVDVCGDYVFGGVPRGANELYAVSTKDLEHAAAQSHRAPNRNILDYVTVHVHADAKLKGFGAAAQLEHAARPTYLLLTGKGIKNIHIWKFQPPLSTQDEPIWESLYDTQTNGNTINLLSFYRNPAGSLLGLSQSDSQKLRLWDLSVEEELEDPKNNGANPSERLKRPPYQDVANSTCALGIAGGFCVCGGPTMYNQLSIVSLDNPKSAYNHTELALPGIGAPCGRGRQRRGDLKQVVNVATLPYDSSHALLELDDVSNYTKEMEHVRCLDSIRFDWIPHLTTCLSTFFI
jgi:WD40 repeat protein